MAATKQTTAQKLQSAAGRLDETLDAQRDVALEAELILERMADDPAFDEAAGYAAAVPPAWAAVLRSIPNFDPYDHFDVQKHLGRIRHARERRCAAGPPERLKTATAQRDAALASASTGELAKVNAQIEQLSKHKAELERAKVVAEAAYTAVIQAREILKSPELMPPFLVLEIEYLRRRAWGTKDEVERQELLSQAADLVEDYVNATDDDGNWTALVGFKTDGKGGRR